MMDLKNTAIFFLTIWTSGASIFGQSATLIYFNDAHELSPVVDNLGNRGGIARLKTVINQIVKNDSSAFVIFGGDLAGGTLCGALYNGHPQVQVFNKLPVHLANFGQHDFDHGIQNTKALISSSHFLWCTSNLKNKSGESFGGLPEFYIRQIRGIRIGIVCLTDAMQTTTPATQIIQQDLLKSLDSILRKLPENLDQIIAVTQTDPDMNKNIIRHFPQIDIILTEEVSEQETHIFYQGECPIVSPCGNMGSVVEIKLERTTENIRNWITVHPLDTTVTEDKGFLNIEHIYQTKMNETLSEPFTFLSVSLDAGITTDHGCRWRETTAGNLIADAFRYHFQTDLAFINGGGIRADIPEGRVTLKAILALLPFGNNIYKVQMKGSVIRQIIEHGLSRIETRGGGFLQISGGNYQYDISKAKGRRLINVQAGNQNLRRNREYTVSISNYLLQGGDGFHLKGQYKLLENTAPQKDVDILKAYCSQFDTLTMQLEGRIQISGLYSSKESK